jgi:hypothetical protein
MISGRMSAALFAAIFLALPATPSRAVAAPPPQTLASVSSQGSETTPEKDVPPVLRTVRAVTPPAIDGLLGDAVWEDAMVASGFTQLRPDPGAPASQRTEVRVAYDDEAIYVSAHMFDTAPDSIVAQLGRRDNEVYSDWFFVALDSYFDRRTAFVFALNPRGVMLDLLLHNDTEDDVSWDAVWEAAADRTADGWTAEFRIPLSQLRFSPPEDGEPRWGVNFMRQIARHGEESFWAPIRPDDGRLVSAFGELRGLDGLEPPRRLEVMPYVVASATSAPGDAENPFHRDVDPFGGVGADIKAGITSDLTLTATINPDFGQVEADPSVVNLSAFETFFPEKRPFFVEGVDIFRFGLGLGDGDLGNESLFYSRRIGRAPQGSIDGDYTDAPEATTILAAAKLSGKTQSGWSIGILDAVTAEEHGDFVLDGAEGETPIEPRTNYGVARVIKDFRDGKSAVGGIFTSTNRTLPGGGALDWLRRSAYTGGLDFRHRFLDERYQVTGSVVGSRVTGTPEAIAEVQTSPVHYFQRPDADYVEYDPSRTSLQGVAAKAELFKIQGKWRWALLGMTLTPGFEANDLGFQTNGDLALGVIWAGYNQYEPGDVFRRWNLGTNLWRGTNFGGDRVALGGNVNGSFQLTSFWGGFGGFNFEAPTYSTSMLRGGPAFLRPATANAWTGMYTDNRKPVSLSMHVNRSWEADTNGGGWSLSPGVEVRPSDNVEFLLGPSFSRSRSALQYVTTEEADGADRWVLGTVDRTTLSMTARLNYTFSPTLSLQLYAQPYISTGDYDDFKLVADPRAGAFQDRVHLLGPGEISAATVDDEREYAVDLDADGEAEFAFDDPSFNFKQLRSNVVLRWEYRPGSAVFLVWSQGRTDYARDGRFRFDRDVDALLGADGTNVLLIKMSYWLGL